MLSGPRCSYRSVASLPLPISARIFYGLVVREDGVCRDDKHDRLNAKEHFH